MALENSENMVMPVGPMYGNNNGFFGNDGAWIILLLLLGWGNGNGFGANGSNQLYPWMNQTDTINGGFRDQFLNTQVNGIRDDIQDISMQMCNGFATAEQGAANRQMANMQSMFNIQSSLQNCCCENRSGIADLKYTIAAEECATRTNDSQNTQKIMDKLCQLELDNVKSQVEAKNDLIANLRDQLNMAALRESQTAQNAFIQQGFSNEVDQLYNRLSNCPVPSTPVYGRTPIFTCSNGACGCGA